MSKNLINRLVLELAMTRGQAEGGAGLLLQWAQSKLTADEFQRVADSIPAISDVIGKSPCPNLPSSRGWLAWFKRQCSGLGRLTPLAEPLHQLEIPPAKLRPCIAVLLRHFHEQADDSEAEQLLNKVLR